MELSVHHIKPLKSVDKCKNSLFSSRKNAAHPFTYIWVQCSLALRKMADPLTMLTATMAVLGGSFNSRLVD